MKLNDARRLAIKSQVEVRFVLSNAMDCVIDRHGLAKIPGLKSASVLNLEDEFAGAAEFFLDSRPTSRAQLESMVGGGVAAPVERDE